ncbi:putative bifunctional SAT/APS kinase [bacterium HR33]|nr:putative bifunctional SAT/APS kinase [bacterium HR33]
MTDHLIAPHGGVLVDGLAGEDRIAELRELSRDWPSWDLTPRQLCDLELLLNGGFSPLAGFLRRRDYERVLSEMRLCDGTLWPIPVTLDVPQSVAEAAAKTGFLALRDPEGVMLAALHVEEGSRLRGGDRLTFVGRADLVGIYRLPAASYRPRGSTSPSSIPSGTPSSKR